MCLSSFAIYVRSVRRDNFGIVVVVFLYHSLSGAWPRASARNLRGNPIRLELTREMISFIRLWRLELSGRRRPAREHGRGNNMMVPPLRQRVQAQSHGTFAHK